MIAYTVGEKYPNPFHLSYQKMDYEAAFNLDGNVSDFHVFYKNVSSNMLRDLAYGGIKVSITSIKGVIFLQLKFGSMPWMDCPINIHYACVDQDIAAPYELINSVTGDIATVVVESPTGIVKSLRAARLPEQVYGRLIKLLVEQQENTSFLPEVYQRTVKDIYSTFTAKDMLKYSLASGWAADIN